LFSAWPCVLYLNGMAMTRLFRTPSFFAPSFALSLTVSALLAACGGGNAHQPRTNRPCP
jgi:hypothetical protein